MCEDEIVDSTIHDSEKGKMLMIDKEVYVSYGGIYVMLIAFFALRY